MAHGDRQDAPRVGEPLPNAKDAIVDPPKLIQYALDPDHPVGRHKATVFRRALNIDLDDWKYLRNSILGELAHCPVSAIRPPKAAHEGFTWEVLVPIRGLGARSSRTLNVITAWVLIDERPELVTVRVAPKTRQATRESG